MNAVQRVFTWTRFVVTEYARSARIAIELTITIAMWALFFQNRSVPITIAQMFSLTGLFGMGLALYTTSAMLSLGDRPQSYVIITRPLGRRGFLLGLYFAAVVVVWAMLALLIALTLLVNKPDGFQFAHLWFGTLPILFNVALVAALMLLLSSLVVRNIPRLLVLAILAVALYANTWNLSSIYGYLSPAQSLFSRLIEPAIAGQRLAVSRDYSGGQGFVLVSQLALTVLLLGLALLSFGRRELILGKK